MRELLLMDEPNSSNKRYLLECKKCHCQIGHVERFGFFLWVFLVRCAILLDLIANN